MIVQDILNTLDGKVLIGESLLNEEIHTACGSDMMSDVLAFVKDRAVLLTGLTNPHVMRTAEMLDLRCVVFVRGKLPTDNILEMAEERDIVVLATELTMFEACGKLYETGLRGGVKRAGE